MAGHGWLTRAENALTSREVNADNLSYDKLQELYGRSPHIERIRVTVQASARTSSELHISSVSAASPSGMAPLDRPHS